jgi:hypothetical protein
MSRRSKRAAAEPLDLSHLRRETRTALELAVAALAPSSIIDELARSAGLLEAILELPADSPPVVALVPSLIERTSTALDAATRWQRKRLGKAKA